MNIKYIFLVDHFTYVLKCKRKCPKTLGSLNGEVYEDFLASHYNYLQYAYFKSKCIFLGHPVTKCIWWQFGEYFYYYLITEGLLAAACQAVASYLLLLPDDESMLANMRYYQALPKVQDDFFTPREVNTYIRQYFWN